MHSENWQENENQQEKESQQENKNQLENENQLEKEDTVGNKWRLKNTEVFAYLWLIVVFIFMVYHMYSYGSLQRKVRSAVMVAPGVREIAGEHLSFVMGIFRPIIYLSAGLDAESRRVVLCHERVHLKRRDYLTKPVALIICCIHWFNPLVWLAFYLMNRDCEVSCDEKVVSLLGEDSKKIYSYALLDEATGGESKAYRKGSACALLSFGENHVKNRVKHVLQYHKASAWMIAGTIVILAVLLAGLPVWQEKTAAELAEEERAAYGVSLRNSILKKDNTVLSVGNRTADNTFALIDMDGDGFTEEIILTPLDDGSQGYGPLDHYKLQCGGGFEERYGQNMCNDIFAFSPDGERIFIALYEDGPSGDPLTTIFRYEYNRLYEAGEIASDIRKWDMENGIIHTVIGNWTVQTDYIKVQYRMNDQGNVELVPQESYEYTDKGGDIWDTLKVSLPLHTSPESEETFLLEPCKVRFLAVHSSWEWVLVETEDGQQGWMHVVDMKVMELDMWTTDVFDGLSMAG